MQAIVITAYKDPEMLYRLCGKFDKDKVRLFIHIDRRFLGEFDVSRLKAFGNVEVYSKYEVTWGSIKHLYAILALMKRALRYEDVKYVHIISGQDYPIADLSEAEEDEHIYLDFAPVLPERFRQYNPCQKLDQRNRIAEHIYRGSVKLQKAAGIERRTIGSYTDIYKGTIWSSMPSAAAGYALNIAENDSVFMRDLYYTYIPEEIFFQTIFMNSCEWKEKIVRTNKRYDDWKARDNSSSVPVVLDERDHDLIVNSDAWFARKMDSSRSGRLLKLLDGIKESEQGGLISAVITTCNREPEILLRALNSVKSQTYENTEIIVINDSAENDEKIKEALKNETKVRLVKNEGDHGVSNVRNLAVREAKGEYIAFLDDDDEWLPDKLKLQIEEFDDETGLVYCDYYAIKDGEILKSDDDKYYPSGDVFVKLLGDNFVGGCSVPLIKRSAIMEAGEFDTNISYGEDYDMWLRIAKNSRIGCVPEKLVNYYIGAPSLTGNFERRVEGWEYIFNKYRDDYNKYPSERDRFLGTNVREAAKRGNAAQIWDSWKKYRKTKETLKGLIMRVMRIY